MTQTNSKTLVIYQTKNGAIELKLDSNVETVWASQKDIVNMSSLKTEM
jgi:hypothetical protein